MIAKINVLYQIQDLETAHSRRSKETNLADIGSVEGAVEAWGGGGGIESPASPSQQFLNIFDIFDIFAFSVRITTGDSPGLPIRDLKHVLMSNLDQKQNSNERFSPVKSLKLVCHLPVELDLLHQEALNNTSFKLADV